MALAHGTGTSDMSLCRLSDCAEALELTHPTLGAWLQTVAKRIKHGLPAAAALELAGPGARRERDKYLCHAATVLRRDDTLWAWAGRLAGRINAPPRRNPDLVDELLDMANQAAPLPRTQRQLYAVLLKNWCG